MLGLKVLAAKGKSRLGQMYFVPCLECGGKPHLKVQCPRFKVGQKKPQTWNSTLEMLGDFPVKGFVGGKLRLRMLKRWSLADKFRASSNSQIPSDPKQFADIDVKLMSVGDLVKWCAFLKIETMNDADARKKLKRKFRNYSTMTIDVHSGTLDVSHPYRCSKYPQDNQKALLHTRTIKVDWDNVFDRYGDNCPENGCSGKIEQNISN